jgi:sucrose phosphorylase
MKNKVQLITYVDRLPNGKISDLKSLFKNEFKDIFGGIHLLPFFYPIDGEDAGFDPIDHTMVDPRLGTWNEIKSLGLEFDIMADLIVNHVSAQSEQFKDYLEKGESSEFAELFLSVDTVFPDGINEDLQAKIYRPRPTSPFTEFMFKNGSSKLLWTTFTQNQVDIDVQSEKGKAYLEGILDTFQEANIKTIRLDAAGYAIKKAGTSCFMIDETYEFIEALTKKAGQRGMAVLVEIHSFYQTQIEIAKKVDFVYDFALPVLVLDTLFHKSAKNLKKWLAIAPRNVVTVLDTHDGIGVVDVASEDGKPGLIDDDSLNDIVEKIHQNSSNTSRKATGAAASNLDLYQVNCTYFEALGKDKNAYLMARAIQFFVPGVPQVYYVGLLAGENDIQLLAKTKVGRDINRHYYSKDEIDDFVKTGFFADFKSLMVLRNTHKAFNGQFELMETPDALLKMQWKNHDEWALLEVDLIKMNFNITHS